jgi:hypothetical protein
MMQAGLITPEAGRRLLDYPDLEAEENLYNAASDYIHMILDKIVEDGEYTAPSPDDNLQLAKKLVLEYIAQGKLNNLKDDRLELLRKFNKQIDYWVNGGPAGEKMRAEQAMIQSQMAAQGIVPQGNPQTPPTSPLIQNVPGVTQ